MQLNNGEDPIVGRLTSGMYVYRLQAGGVSISKKMMLMK
jgi:hypothetical protein